MHPHAVMMAVAIVLLPMFKLSSTYNEQNHRSPHTRKHSDLGLNHSPLPGGDYSDFPDYNIGSRKDTAKNEQDYTANLDDGSHDKSSVLLRSKDESGMESLHGVDNWPDPNIQLGQLSAVSIDMVGNVVVFHRGDRVWNGQTFLANDIYNERNLGPISQNTIVSLDPITGAVLRQWGSNMFYMPHGLTVDSESNVWVTDVALHQVFKFAPNSSTPILTLGVRFMPGKDDAHFCKPSDAVAMRNGDFFVSDGYCNTRVMKFSKSGRLLMQWGRNTFHMGFLAKFPAPYEFNVPHALALAEDKDMVCVADRENGRIQCFNCHNGTFIRQHHSPRFGTKIFSVAYSSAQGGMLYIVNGPDYQSQVAKGFVISLTSNEAVEEFIPNDKPFSNPHDVAVSPDGNLVYVVELNPYKVWKFQRGNANTTASIDITPHFKSIALSTSSTAKQSLQRSRESSNSVGTAVGIIIIVIAILGIVFAVAVVRMRKRGKRINVYSDEHNVHYSKLMTEPTM